MKCKYVLRVTSFELSFVHAWNIWAAGGENFIKMSGIKSELSSDRIYKILNNLIEKSIGNYFIKIDWESALKKWADLYQEKR